ncbi:MAG TPA: SDR family NAD(P)-dependent oxidoreductase, partial [Thermodesulfovibrionales bacterium]|nr:SDR family NAD(P)-dependent oxidoreductase [Thermodesulfovibrionales bacterium]
MKIDLSNKVALVTGGSRGIGRETSVCLAEAGARVIINYNRSHGEAEKVKDQVMRSGGDAEIFQADIGLPEEIERLFAWIRKDYGRLDILVNNAGMIKDNLLLSMTLTEWDKVVNLNLRGAFLCTRHAAEMMLSTHSGKVINIASISAIKGGRGQTTSAAAKGGLIAFTRACAVELSGKGIQVNAILPGMITTDMTTRVRKRAGEM